MPSARLSVGEIEYEVSGSGDPIVFVHGALMNGRVWERLTPLLSDRFQCIVPTLPLGSHRLPIRADADLALPAQAQVVASLLEALDLKNVTLVGNDTGTAISQLVALHHGQRLSRLVLTNGDAFENCPPRDFAYMKYAVQVPGAPQAMAWTLCRLPILRRLPWAFGKMSVRPIPEALVRSWLEPALYDASVRRDLRKVMAGTDRRYTLDAAARLPMVRIPTLIAWAAADTVYPRRDADRLAALLPMAQRVFFDESRVLLPLDRPAELADSIASFINGSRAIRN